MNTPPELEELIHLTGEPYRARRDELLQRGNLGDRLHSLKTGEDVDWKPRVMAAILDGWRQRKALYNSVLAELDAVDLAWESKKVTGIAGIWERFALRAHREYRTNILPLCWEVVLKFGNDWPDWKVTTFLRMMDVVPDEQSVLPLIQFVEVAKDPEMRAVATESLSRQPSEAVKLAIHNRLQRPANLTPATAAALRQASQRAESPR